MGSAASQIQTADPGALTEGSRLINTFIAPSKTFTDLRRSAAWWGPFLVMSLVSIMLVYIVDQKIGFRKVVDNQIQMSPKQAERMEKMPAPDREQALGQQAKGWRVFSYGYPTIILLWNLAVAGVLLATFKFGFSANLKFKTMLAIVMYASLPIIIKSLLAALSIVAGMNVDSFIFQNPIASNLGAFFSPADSPFLYNLGSAIDIFMIWTLALTAIGISCAGGVKRSNAMLGVFGWYALFALAGASMAAAFS